MIRALTVGGTSVAFHRVTSTVPVAAQPGQSSARGRFPRGAIIRTVLKDLPPDAVGGPGAILFHEHFSMNSVGVHKRVPTVDPNRPYYTEDVPLMIDELTAAMKAGLACAVDAGHADIGRNIQHLREMSKASGLHIVASGGYHTQPTYPPEIARQTADQIAKEFVRQAKAERWGAFGEIGSAAVMTPDERKVFHAIGKAQVGTNLPIFTHTEAGKPALEQLDIFETSGVSPAKVMIGHMGAPADLAVAKEVCKRGAYLGFDQIARSYTRPDLLANEIKLMTSLIDAGYVDHLLLGTDLVNLEQTRRGGGAGYGGALTIFVPKLRESGVKEDALRRILIENPRRLLAFVPMGG
jgi:phosphotriesterase-related protein